MHYFEYYKVWTKEDRDYEVLAKMISISRRGVCPFVSKMLLPKQLLYCIGLYSDTLSLSSIVVRKYSNYPIILRLHCTQTDTRQQTKWFFTSFVHGL